MNFELSGTQKAIQKLARDFAAKELAPTVVERDENDIFGRDVIDKAGALGITTLPFPEEYGGGGADYVSYILALEEICKVDDGIGTALAVNTGLFGWPVYKYGTEEQKQKWLKPMATENKLCAFCLTEPGAGSDAAMQQTVAVLEGDNYIINGSKIFITNAGDAEFYLIFAMTDKSKGLKGISAFLAEKGTPGLDFGKTEHKLGIHTSVTREVIFQNLKVPKSGLLGKEGEGFKIAMTTLDGGRISIAAQAVGIAQAAIDHAIKYTKERVQFGKPISSNQGLQWMIADMQTAVDAARLLTLRAADMKDRGEAFGKEAAMAKLFAGDTAMWVTTDAVQLFGGYGYTREYPVERLMRNAKITQIYEGTNQVQRMVIAASILR
jgi:alkylation response protein AidB-like acyl-CoA dehydrogenase